MLCFSFEKEGNLWTTLLEKAWAKHQKSFEQRPSLQPQHCARDLTGAPSYKYDIGDHPNLFEMMVEACQKGYIITANCGGKNISEKGRADF